MADFNAVPGRAQPGLAQPGSPGATPTVAQAAPVFGYARAGTGQMTTVTTAAGTDNDAIPGRSQPGMARPGWPVTPATATVPVTFGSARAGTWP